MQTRIGQSEIRRAVCSLLTAIRISTVASRAELLCLNFALDETVSAAVGSNPGVQAAQTSKMSSWSNTWRRAQGISFSHAPIKAKITKRASVQLFDKPSSEYISLGLDTKKTATKEYLLIQSTKPREVGCR